MNATGFDEDELKEILKRVCEEVRKENYFSVRIGGNFRLASRIEELRDSVVRKLQVYADLGSFQVNREDILITEGQTDMRVDVIGQTAARFLGE